MNESLISVRYAKALFQSALENDKLDRVYQDMELLAEICRMDEFQLMLNLPFMQAERKSRLVNSLLEKQLSGLSMSMIHLAIKNKRESYLPGIARHCMDLFREEKGIRSARLVTATEVDEETLENIRQMIGEAFDSEVELSTSVDDRVVGGFKITVGDLQYDASVATSLRKMKHQLLQNR